MNSLKRLDLGALREKHHIVGRDQELAALAACMATQRHVLLEGPVGVGKTVLARVVAQALGRGVHRLDGDGRHTEQKLVGHFDPPAVMRLGYQPEAFIEGPLVQAMKTGAVLFINEINRMPEGVQNVLLPVMDEHLLVIPHMASVVAQPGFCVIATMNPREFVATGHLSEALLDRFELILLHHQSEQEEREIVHQNTPKSTAEVVAEAVAIVRRTRNHPQIRRGASVRGAIAISELAHAMGGLQAMHQAAAIALPTRIELKEAQEGVLEALLAEVAPEKKN